MIKFYPNNPEIEKIFNRLTKQQGTVIHTTRLMADIGKNKAIKKLRAKNHIYFGYDRQKHHSIIFFPPNVKVKKKDNGCFFFEINQF